MFLAEISFHIRTAVKTTAFSAPVRGWNICFIRPDRSETRSFTVFFLFFFFSGSNQKKKDSSVCQCGIINLVRLDHSAQLSSSYVPQTSSPCDLEVLMFT